MTASQALLDSGFATHLAIHGETVQLLPAGGSASAITVIFDESTGVIDSNVQTITEIPMARTWTASLPSPVEGARLIRNGVTYHVTKAERDKVESVTHLLLSRDTLVPIAPSDLSVDLSSGNAVLTWTRNATNNANVEVWSDVDGDGHYSRLAVLGAEVTTHTDTGAAVRYKVRNTNRSGPSAFAVFDLSQMILVDEFGSPILDESGHPILATP
jgi:hypothetical protein